MTESKYEPTAAEAKWRQRWDQWGIHCWDPGRSRDETFAVDTPPPTVSGSLHVGHVFSYTHQDLLVRFHRMMGLGIFYPMGWDDNGLPTERRVQNYFNVRCDPGLNYDPTFQPQGPGPGPPRLISRKNFIELCHTMTAQDEVAFKELWSRLGLSVDWSLEYATIDNHCRRISQISFIRLFEMGAAYQTSAPTMWDVDFQTAVAQAEIEDRQVRGHFHHIRFGVEGGGGFSVLTTRPELLAACVAVTVHPDDERHKDLVGKGAITPVFHVPVPILADPRVDPQKGTGIVMVCTFGDATDVDWWREHGLPLRQIIDRSGHLVPVEFGRRGWDSQDPASATEAFQKLQGSNLKQARAQMVQLLRNVGALLGEPEQTVHAVKFYEKGDQPLELIPTRQWFIRVLEHRQALIEAGERITWHPAFMGVRYRNWVEGLNQDWCISRQRYFGVPFPVWYPVDQSGQVLYDKPILADIERLPVDPLSDAPPGYSEEMRGQPCGFVGDPDVQDTWATSSLTPQIVTGWESSPERHERLFPMDIRPQAHEIIRTWAFYTITKSWLHHREIPWRNIVISGWILDPDRKKMSKSKGNVVTPTHLLDTYSSDAVRYWAAKARAGVDTAYDEAVFRVGKRLVTKLYNASRFVGGCLGNLDRARLRAPSVVQELDRGFISSLRETIERATSAYRAFEWAGALETVESFFWSEFCDDYLEFVKHRAYREQLDDGKLSALATLRISLSTLLRLFAPTIPFITEELWSKEFASGEDRGRSIHTSPWPALEELAAIADPADPSSYAAARTILADVRRAKGAESKSMRWPVAQLQIEVPDVSSIGLHAVLEDVRAAGVVDDVELREGEKMACQVHLAPGSLDLERS
jgi:valyl-tRNA synthetase